MTLIVHRHTVILFHIIHNTFTFIRRRVLLMYRHVVSHTRTTTEAKTVMSDNSRRRRRIGVINVGMIDKQMRLITVHWTARCCAVCQGRAVVGR